MLCLFVDTETTGFVQSRMPQDHESQPHLVQLAMILRDGRKEVASANLVVRCPIEVPEKARAVHGYDQAATLRLGVWNYAACLIFQEMAEAATRIVAHHADFDRQILEIALGRAVVLIPWQMDNAPWFCTMQAAEPLCKIPATPGQLRAGFKRPGEFKQPKLEEALRILCGHELQGAHDALADVRGCARLYDWLEDNGHIQDVAA